MRGGLGATFAALAVRDFRYLWLGNFPSQIGVWLQAVAQGWLAYVLTDSGAFLGVVGLARAAPSILLTLPAGALADRWDRRLLLIASEVIGMANAVALAGLVAAGAIEPWHLLATSVVSGVSHSINIPARQSLAPELAGPRHLANAIALNAISFNTSRVIGPAIAGVLIGLWGIASCFGGQAAGHVWALAWTLAIRDTGEPRGAVAHGSLWANMVDGLRYTKESPPILATLGVSPAPIALGMIYAQLMPMMARDVLEVGASGMGTLMTAVGVGSLLGAVAAAVLSEHPRKDFIQIASGAALVVASMMVLGYTSAQQPLPPPSPAEERMGLRRQAREGGA